MTKLVLEGGTDVAAVAVFAVAALQPEPADSGTLDALAAREGALGFEMGGDGGYSMQAWVDESVPDAISRYCVRDEVKEGFLDVPDGRLGFGGLESLSSSYKPNANIREDASIPPGRYEIRAYPTDIPEEAWSAALRERIGGAGMLALNIQGFLMLLVVVATFVVFVVATWYAALGVFVVGMLSAIFGYSAIPAVRRWEEAKGQLKRDFPSIVVEMRKA